MYWWVMTIYVMALVWDNFWYFASDDPMYGFQSIFPFFLHDPSLSFDRRLECNLFSRVTFKRCLDKYWLAHLSIKTTGIGLCCRWVFWLIVVTLRMIWGFPLMIVCLSRYGSGSFPHINTDIVVELKFVELFGPPSHKIFKITKETTAESHYYPCLSRVNGCKNTGSKLPTW